VDTSPAELTRALNSLISFPADTKLELVIPEPLAAETLSLPSATQQALASNPEIVEAEQTLVKAQAAAKLSKLEYIPDVAVMGGYAYQTAVGILPLDFSFIGVVATYNVFDFGKRENTIKERQTNVELAQLNLQGVKSKVTGVVQKTFGTMQNALRVREATRAALLAISPDDRAERSRAEAEMAQAELDYRLACADFHNMIGVR
jgi:outer membrane protein TolC